MLKQLYKYMAVFLLAGTVISCSPDALDDVPLTEGDVPILLDGMLTRSALIGNEDGELIKSGYPLEAYSGISFRLAARTVEEPISNYFINSSIGIGDTGDAEGRNKITGNVYYPLGKKAINLFAYTGGNAQADGNITLSSGTDLSNDYLLGKGTDDTGVVVSGKSDAPIEYITFKHLMTRVDVKIEVAGDVQAMKPQSISMDFDINENSIVANGTYNIFDDTFVKDSSSGQFGFAFNADEIANSTTKTYYLVPNGADLTGASVFNSLEIDDYEATPDDLANLEFSEADKEGVKTNFVLEPGLAYDLTFVINRLQIVDIQLTLKDWEPVEANTGWDYQPYTMTLDTGGEYKNTASEEAMVSKMVLMHENADGETYQYIGKGRLEEGENKIDFVTLPENLESGELTAVLYTVEGLLAYNMEIEVGTTGTNLEVLHMNKYGMKKASDTEGDYFEVSTSLQLRQLISDTNKTDGERYVLVDDLDMGHTTYTIIPSDFPENSTLDGNGYDIIQLDVTGNGLFTVNNGTLRNVRIASGLIRGDNPANPMGAICQVNNGKIEAVVNQAYIQPAEGQAIVGGIAGENGVNGTILATVNTGDVLGGTTVGGIVGNNKNSTAGAIKASLNIGLLNKEATVLGGIVGTSVEGTSGAEIVNTCAWLTGTARKVQSVSDEVAIGNDPTGGTDKVSADLATSRIRSDEAINILNGASTPWKFRLIENLSSWPIAITKPTNP